MSQLKMVMGALRAALMLIAAVSELNAMLLSTRERFREFGVFKEIGLTPRQVLASVTTSAAILAGLAVVAGIPLDLWLVTIGLNAIAQSVGLIDVQIGVNWLAVALLVQTTL